MGNYRIQRVISLGFGGVLYATMVTSRFSFSFEFGGVPYLFSLGLRGVHEFELGRPLADSVNKSVDRSSGPYWPFNRYYKRTAARLTPWPSQEGIDIVLFEAVITISISAVVARFLRTFNPDVFGFDRCIASQLTGFSG